MSSVATDTPVQELKNIFGGKYSDEVLEKIASVFVSPSANLLFTVDVAAAIAENSMENKNRTKSFPEGLDKSIALFVVKSRVKRRRSTEFAFVERAKFAENLKWWVLLRYEI